MKFFPILILATFFFTTSAAQVKIIDDILKAPETRQSYYEMVESGSKVIYLPMSYGKADFTINQSLAIAKLQHVQIAGIDLVYSDFPPKADFSALNLKRLNALYKLLPEAFAPGKIVFRKVRQTAARNREEASWLVHGFYIYYRELPDKARAEAEIKKIKAVFDTVATKRKVSTAKDSIGPIKICSEWSVVTDTANYYPPKENFTRTIKKMAYGDAKRDNLIYPGYEESYKGHDSVYYVLDINEDSCSFWDGVYIYNNIDSTVSRVFERHKWNKAMIVADVTGSMYPYSTQLLLWLKLTMTDGLRRQFVFFNDGDMKSDAEKLIGKTGGIYKVVTSKFTEVEDRILEAMKNGSGGDAPENNIEALLAAEKECISCDSVVMIADNWAPVKDISLLAAVKHPVKIILCGVYGPVNPDYLTLARKTGGSLHLIERDIYELSLMKEGDSIDIGGTRYKIVDGTFRIDSKKSM